MNCVLTPSPPKSEAFTERASAPPDTWRQQLGALEETVARLSEDVARLREENAQRRRENTELKQEAGYWRAMHARATEREAKVAKEIEAARGEIRKLQARLFAQKSERSKSRDRSNHLPDPKDPETSGPPRPRGQQSGRRGPGRRDYSHLPAVEEFVELSDEQQCCQTCGRPRRPRSDTEDSEQIEIDVRAHRRVIRRRRNEATCVCPTEPPIQTAPAPPKLIPKSRFGISVWVHLLLEKFYLHRPLERAISALALHGLPLSPGTITGGLRRIEPMFEAVYRALAERQAAAGLSQADETRWMVFVEREGKKGYRWWLWVFLSDEAVVFRLAPSRSHEVPEGHFPEDAIVVLMVDRYSAYKAMAQVNEVGKGWPNLKEWALVWLRHIRELYRLNRLRLAAEPDSAEFREADEALRQSILAMREQRDGELSEKQLRSPCRKALESLENHWEGLVRFVDDPRIPMDNNASERQARGPALGRKNYYGSGAEWSGRLAAMLFSIFATLNLWKLNPQRWLTWFLGACAAAGGRAPADISGFLPWNLTDERRAALSDPVPPSAGSLDAAFRPVGAWELPHGTTPNRPPPDMQVDSPP